MTERQDKYLETIIAKHGSWENYVAKRYNDPSKAETRKRVSAKGGAATPKESRGFSRPGVASKAAKKMWENKQRANSKNLS